MDKFKGFGILELVIVILLLGIVALAVKLSPPAINNFRADSFAGVVLQDLQLTKVLSMSQNQRYRFVTGASSYQIQNSSGTAIVNPSSNSTTLTYPSGVTVTPTTTVIFDSLGKPYDSTNTALSSALTLTISTPTVTKTVVINPQTGLIQ